MTQTTFKSLSRLLALFWLSHLSKHPVKVRWSRSQLGGSKSLGLRRGLILFDGVTAPLQYLQSIFSLCPRAEACERCANMPLLRKRHTHTATSSVKFSPSLRWKVKTTLSLQLNISTLIRISCMCTGMGGAGSKAKD